MIAVMVYAIGFAWLCYEAARHGALGLLVTSLWVWAVCVYGLLGALVCRSINRRALSPPKPRAAERSEMIRAAIEADRKARAETGAK